MQGLKHKRTIAKFLCFLMILEMFVASPNVAEAKSEGIKRGTLKEITVAANEDPLTITLYDPSKPENTKVVSSTVPSWITVTKTSYYSASFTVKFQKNTSSSRTATIQFTEGSYIWYAKITQNKPTPTPTPKPKKSSNNNGSKNNTPSKGSTPTPKATPVPTSTPTSTPELTASEASLGFPADGATKTVTISGYTGPLRADRNDTWFTVSVSGGTISVTATKNTSTARASYVDVTDTGSGRSVRIQVTQAAPIINPGPTKAPTSTPTPVPAETLPVKTKTLDFSAQGGQGTISLDGKGYNLTFTYQDNPSIPSGWVGMVYDGSTIKVKVNRNKDYSARSMKVKITDTKTNQYAYVTINQKAAPKPTPTPTPFLSVDCEEIACGYEGSEGAITISGVRGKLTFDYSWTPNTVTGWVEAKLEGNRIQITVDKNLSINPREAIITITDSKTLKSVTISIVQDNMPNSVNVNITLLRVDSDAMSFRSCAEEKILNTSGKIGTLQVQRVGSDEWFSAVVKGGTVEISVKKNTGDLRRGYLDVTDTGSGQRVRVTITQEAGLKLDKSSITLDCIASSNNIVTAYSGETLQIDYEWNSSEQMNWVELQRIQSANPGSETKYSIVTKENTTYVDRIVTVKLSSGSGKNAYIVITQKGKTAPELGVSNKKVDFQIDGGTSEIKITNAIGNIDYELNKDITWIRVVKSGENTFSIITKKNDTGSYRAGSVSFTDSITGKKVWVQVLQHYTAHVVFYVYEQDKPNGEVTEVTLYRLQYYGEKYEDYMPKSPQRKGYTFDGWYTEKGLGKGYEVFLSDIFDETENIYLYAHWIKNEASLISLELNYDNCPKDKLTCKAFEGKPIEKMPTPPERVGFEFAGWYTIPTDPGKTEHNIHVKNGTVFTGDEMSTLYAHWKATVAFSDFAFVGAEIYTTKAKEGWGMTIPDEVLKLYDIMGFKVKGWTSSGNSTVTEKGSTRDYYFVTCNLKNPTVSLWAINADGLTFRQFLLKKFGQLLVAEGYYKVAMGIDNQVKNIKQSVDETIENGHGLEEWISRTISAVCEYNDSNSIPNTAEKSPDCLDESIMDEVSPPYLASDEAKGKNGELIKSKEVQDDLKSQDGYINGQKEGKKASIRVGETDFANAGCGVIATYNALHSFGLGYEKDEIEGLIEYFETNGYLMNCPEEVKKYLENELEKREKKNIEDETTKGLRSTLAAIKEYGAEKAGGIGANPYAIDDVLSAYGVKTNEYRDYNAFLNDVLSAIQRGEHKKYIVDFWNGGETTTGHFVFFETVACGDKPITAYNWGSKDTKATGLSFSQLKAKMIEGDHVRFINAYEVYK